MPFTRALLKLLKANLQHAIVQDAAYGTLLREPRRVLQGGRIMAEAAAISGNGPSAACR
jgi:hypothetical protein